MCAYKRKLLGFKLKLDGRWRLISKGLEEGKGDGFIFRLTELVNK